MQVEFLYFALPVLPVGIMGNPDSSRTNQNAPLPYNNINLLDSDVSNVANYLTLEALNKK